jgi:hypothetical protein
MQRPPGKEVMLAKEQNIILQGRPGVKTRVLLPGQVPTSSCNDPDQVTKVTPSSSPGSGVTLFSYNFPEMK